MRLADLTPVMILAPLAALAVAGAAVMMTPTATTAAIEQPRTHYIRCFDPPPPPRPEPPRRVAPQPTPSL